MSKDEMIRTSGSSSYDMDGTTYAKFQADGVVRQGILYVEHRNDNGTQTSKITLDTNRDGTPDYTFIDDGKQPVYFTTGDRAVAVMEPSKGQHFTQDILALLQTKVDLKNYRQVADFVMSPSTQHLPHVRQPKQR